MTCIHYVNVEWKLSRLKIQTFSINQSEWPTLEDKCKQRVTLLKNKKILNSLKHWNEYLCIHASNQTIKKLHTQIYWHLMYNNWFRTDTYCFKYLTALFFVPSYFLVHNHLSFLRGKVVERWFNIMRRKRQADIVCLLEKERKHVCLYLFVVHTCSHGHCGKAYRWV